MHKALAPPHEPLRAEGFFSGIAARSPVGMGRPQSPGGRRRPLLTSDRARLREACRPQSTVLLDMLAILSRLCCWTAVLSSGHGTCRALPGRVPPQHPLHNQVGARCGFCSPPRLLAVELIQKKTGDLSKAIQVPEQTLIFPSPRASQKPKHLTSGEEKHFTACAKLYTRQMRGSAMWVSCTDTCFPPSSLDSTQTVCKTLFDYCSRVDDCQLL